MTRSLHPGPECPCVSCLPFRKFLGGSKEASKPEPKCPHCKGLLLRATISDRVERGLDVEWLCHNDYCVLNEKSASTKVAEDAVIGLVLLVRMAFYLGGASLLAGLIWLLWRALSE